LRSGVNPANVSDMNPTTCAACGYNLPFHGPGCAENPTSNARAFCPAHAPHVAAIPSDDQRLTCTTCGANGYHVKRFAR
jgi:ribosomal protein L37E